MDDVALCMFMCVGIWMCSSALDSVGGLMGDVVCCLYEKNIGPYGLSFLLCLFLSAHIDGNSLS